MSSAYTAAAPRSPLVWVFLLLLMLASGAAIPAQGRVNAALTTEIGDPVLAATISFSVGSVILLLVTFGTGRGRRALGRVAPAVREGRIRWWYFLAGCVGAYFVLTQTLSIGLIGVAVFTVAVVTGQTLGGLLWDRIGLGPAGRMRLNPFRVGGAALTVLAVLWAVSPQLAASGQGPAWLALVLLPLSGGFLQAAQQAINGRHSAAYQSPAPGTLFNFLAGTLFLLLVWAGKAVVSGVDPALSLTWWHYLGGPLGIIFIALGALLVTRVGVLIAAMGMIAGQLLGSLLLDVLLPTPGSLVTTATVLGTGLTLLAVVLASLPDILRGRPGPKSRA
ncbi:DMT family transporter [Nesterenkonia aurantiaca]|uniref:DMT family transporter n=1 Tax=Nesterenkonia aurantiaca TaxID=1436010 RepID=UPI003EE4B027